MVYLLTIPECRVNTATTLMTRAVHLLVEKPLKTLGVVAPALVLMTGVGLITLMAAPELLMLDHVAPDLSQIRGGGLALMLLTGFILSYALMAILWHRYTLRDARGPAPLGPLLIFGYVWRVLALAVIQLAASLLLVVPLILASQSSTSASDGPGLFSVMLSTFVTQMILLWLSLRLSLILPAAAIGRPIAMRTSWRHTRPVSGALWGVAVALAAFNTLLTGVTTLLNLDSPAQMLALELPFYVVEGLLIFSVLTTLYAQQIQHNKTGTP